MKQRSGSWARRFGPLALLVVSATGLLSHCSIDMHVGELFPTPRPNGGSAGSGSVDPTADATGGASGADASPSDGNGAGGAEGSTGSDGGYGGGSEAATADVGSDTATDASAEGSQGDAFADASDAPARDAGPDTSIDAPPTRDSGSDVSIEAAARDAVIDTGAAPDVSVRDAPPVDAGVCLLAAASCTRADDCCSGFCLGNVCVAPPSPAKQAARRALSAAPAAVVGAICPPRAELLAPPTAFPARSRKIAARSVVPAASAAAPFAGRDASRASPPSTAAR